MTSKPTPLSPAEAAFQAALAELEQTNGVRIPRAYHDALRGMFFLGWNGSLAEVARIALNRQEGAMTSPEEVRG